MIVGVLLLIKICCNTTPTASLDYRTLDYCYEPQYVKFDRKQVNIEMKVWFMVMP